MPKHIKPCRVMLTAHAVEQCRARGGGKLTANRVRGALMSKLRMGAQVVNEAVSVYIGDTLQAVCVPDYSGGWIVVTVEPERAEWIKAAE